MLDSRICMLCHWIPYSERTAHAIRNMRTHSPAPPRILYGHANEKAFPPTRHTLHLPIRAYQHRKHVHVRMYAQRMHAIHLLRPYRQGQLIQFHQCHAYVFRHPEHIPSGRIVSILHTGNRHDTRTGTAIRIRQDTVAFQQQLSHIAHPLPPYCYYCILLQTCNIEIA